MNGDGGGCLVNARDGRYVGRDGGLGDGIRDNNLDGFYGCHWNDAVHGGGGVLGGCARWRVKCLRYCDGTGSVNARAS